MTLSTGTRLGPYEITSVLGAGGMGEVYRARDGKLKRDVALKVLPKVFVFEPDRLSRFRREAQILASLNHENIGAIYGFEESGDLHALVLELVPGPTLSDRLMQGPIAIDEALPIARQIAEALEAAHEQGIVHRDLKPGNIKLRVDGVVKVLDFGLAKALERSATLDGDAVASSIASVLVHQSCLQLARATPEVGDELVYACGTDSLRLATFADFDPIDLVLRHRLLIVFKITIDDRDRARIGKKMIQAMKR